MKLNNQIIKCDFILQIYQKRNSGVKKLQLFSCEFCDFFFYRTHPGTWICSKGPVNLSISLFQSHRVEIPFESFLQGCFERK